MLKRETVPMLDLENLNPRFSDSYGQLSVEYVFILVISMIVIFSTYYIIINENEINVAMEAAKSGANEGALVDGMAVYTNNEYYTVYLDKKLTHTKYIQIVDISYFYNGFNPQLQRPEIDIQVTALSNTDLTNEEKSRLSQKINTRIRRSIIYTFNTLNYTSAPSYDTCYSDNYCFLTKDVIWV